MENIPYEKRYTAKIWQTLNRTFKITHVGNLEMIFLASSESILLAICLDIGIVEKSDWELIFDLILGIENLSKCGIVLSYCHETIHKSSSN